MGARFSNRWACFCCPFAAFAIYLCLRRRYPLAVEHWTAAG